MLAYFGIDEKTFSREYPVPHSLELLLTQARRVFLDAQDAESLFAALGFHIGSEYYGHEEFSFVDAYLRENRADLVASLEASNGAGSSYSWIEMHTILEVQHYQAAVQAANMAAQYYCRQEDALAMEGRIKFGFETFVDLQMRYYEAILDNAPRIVSRGLSEAKC